MTDVLNKLIRASMPILLAIAMIFSVVPMPEGYAAWDGYNETSKQKIDLLDFSSISEIEKANGIVDISYATKGYSIYWANHTTSQPVIDIQSFPSGVPFDWTGYQVEMKIYSSKATDAPMKIVFHSVRNEQNQVQYFHGDFNADWVGWKTLKFEVSKLSKGRNPDITKMAQRIQIVGHKEYGIEGKPDTELWISELKLIPSDIAFDTAFYGEEKIAQTYDVLENSVAVFANGTNAVTGEGRIPIEYSIDYTNETVMIPVTLFKDFLGAEVCNKEGAYCVRLNGKAVWGKVSSNEISIDSGADLSTTQTLGTTPYDKDGICYVPGAEIASLVGLSTVTDGRFLALGTPEMKAAITRPESLGVNEFNEIAAHQSYSKEIDLESFTEADTAVAKAN